MRYGVALHLEKEADRLIAQSLKGVNRKEDKADVLTAWKVRYRRGHEVHVDSGTPDSSLRQGMFHRAANTRQEHLNSRGGVVRSRRNGIGGTLSAYYEYNGFAGDD